MKKSVLTSLFMSALIALPLSSLHAMEFGELDHDVRKAIIAKSGPQGCAAFRLVSRGMKDETNEALTLLAKQQVQETDPHDQYFKHSRIFNSIKDTPQEGLLFFQNRHLIVHQVMAAQLLIFYEGLIARRPTAQQDFLEVTLWGSNWGNEAARFNLINILKDGSFTDYARPYLNQADTYIDPLTLQAYASQWTQQGSFWGYRESLDENQATSILAGTSPASQNPNAIDAALYFKHTRETLPEAELQRWADQGAEFAGIMMVLKTLGDGQERDYSRANAEHKQNAQRLLSYYEHTKKFGWAQKLSEAVNDPDPLTNIKNRHSLISIMRRVGFEADGFLLVDLLKQRPERRP